MAVTISDEVIDYIKKEFRRGRVASLTGAGISAESGIPTFRGKGGLWEKYNPEIYANVEGLTSIFRNHPQKLVSFVVDFYSLLFKARPNPAHLALAGLEKDGILNAVITQNIDNLHTEAGSRNVVELHGNAFRARCMRCSKAVVLNKNRLEEMVELLLRHKESRLKLLRVLSRYFSRCDCGARYRIDIVLFGEMLPQDQLIQAYKYLDSCSTLLLVGTSLAVYPAASLPLYAKDKGVKLIEINSEESAFSHLCDYKIRGKASTVLPEILDILKR